ncbi:MAG TPA: hypothetical protein VGH99_14820 [Pseudonocardia sp.]
MPYVILAVASELEAERLRQDLAENPGAPLHTPRWANAVHATLVAEPTAPAVPVPAVPVPAVPVARHDLEDRVHAA